MSIRVLLQAGHLAPREPGFESQTGAAGEQPLVASVRNAVAANLNADGRFDVTSAPGALPRAWVGARAVFLHADASGSPAAHGYSFGYQTSQGQRLATRIAQGFEWAHHPGGHRADNYTPDEHYYYGFQAINAEVEVLVELGFLTNPTERRWLERNVGLIARAISEAIRLDLGLSPKPVVRGSRPTWADHLELWITKGETTRKWIGWAQAFPAVVWVAQNGLRPGTTAAIAWGDGPTRRVERDPARVVSVCRSLVAIERRRGYPQ